VNHLNKVKFYYLKIPKKHWDPHKLPSRATCGPSLWVPDLDLSISSRKNVSRPQLSLIVSRGLHSNKIQYTLFQFFLPNLSSATCSESVLFLPKIDNDFWWCCAVAHLGRNIVHHCFFHKFHCDCFRSDIDGVQNKVICLWSETTYLWSETTYSMNVASTWRLRVGFAYRLCRLKPRASRSKGAPTNCGTHRVNMAGI